MGPRREDSLGGADVADARQQLLEVVVASGRLEASVVHGEALHRVLAEDARGPLAKARADGRSDAVADGEDGVEGVVEWERKISLVP